jgi:hypothetical protein
MNPRRTSVVVVALASALMPTVADAKTFEGETELGKYAEVATAPTGIPKRVFIQWKTPCNRDDLTFVGATRFGRPLDEASADRVSDERVYESRSPPSGRINADGWAPSRERCGSSRVTSR